MPASPRVDVILPVRVPKAWAKKIADGAREVGHYESVVIRNAIFLGLDDALALLKKAGGQFPVNPQPEKPCPTLTSPSKTTARKPKR